MTKETPQKGDKRRDGKESGAMILLINGKEVPVKWEDNDSVSELKAQASSGDIVVKMSMYGGWEQVGSLGKSYASNDTRIDAHCGDIMLYDGSRIVLFYGSNSWAYTKLGKMNLPTERIKGLLGKGNVTLTLRLK